MKTVWRFFSSLWLTIALSGLICGVAAWGSLVTIRHQGFFRALDQEILLPRLFAGAASELSLTLWVFILMLLIFLFAINAFVCTADKLWSIIKTKRPWQALFPHIVHIGFLIALTGHLSGSVWGFRSPGNLLFQGAVLPVPHMEGLFVRLDDLGIKQSVYGDVEELRAKVTLLSKGEAIITDDIEINGPLIYKGVALYHADQGTALTGLILDIDGETRRARLSEAIRLPDGGEFLLGAVYPDFSIDPGGSPYSRGEEYNNPHVEITSGAGQRAYLPLSAPGGSATLEGKKIRLMDFIMTPYVIVNISNDPGIWLVIAGSAILVAGMVLLLFFRGERAELVRQEKEASVAREGDRTERQA
ncbi:MAG: cytochrome c biogenesis protein ResB [Deltaproteobacteria bacterium]|nr:cytochrome c biogenesis protein ResB [Deltaproteobacteria bacterium]